MKKKLQVFVSSTYTDLLPERQAAVQAILKAGHIPAGMELFTASDKSQWETIKRWINESDAYMLILGGRYGSIDPTTNVSYTEMEYDYALEQGKPLFSVVIKEDALEQRVKIHGTSVIETVNPASLKLFREKVLRNISSFFVDDRDVRLAVHETLGEMRDNPDLKGWISGEEVDDTKDLHAQIETLKEENKRLSEALAKAQEKSKRANSDADLEEIISILEKTIIELPEKLTGKKDVEISLLYLTETYSDHLINGITSNTVSDLLRFLYHNVCPKLAVHNLMESEKVTGTSYVRRSVMTPTGKALLAELARRKHLEKSV